MNREDSIKMLMAAGVFYDDEEVGPHVLNMNDTWAWATAWGEEVAEDDLVEVARLFWAYGNAGLLYWVSQKNDCMRSEFYDNNRAIEFVENEERIRNTFPGSSERAYHKESYTIKGERGNPMERARDDRD